MMNYVGMVKCQNKRGPTHVATMAVLTKRLYDGGFAVRGAICANGRG